MFLNLISDGSVVVENMTNNTIDASAHAQVVRRTKLPDPVEKEKGEQASLSASFSSLVLEQGNSLLRILNVAAFAVSGYASAEGITVNLSILWQETYEADFPEKGIRFFGEGSWVVEDVSGKKVATFGKGKLPPTDSRLRPDQRHLENGEYDKANAEKLRLETRQRMSRKLQENGWTPSQFQKEGEDGTFRYFNDECELDVGLSESPKGCQDTAETDSEI
ncbi:hypothetical protein HAX54_029496 [Datura stramonium]|uniref:Uncharacterized protein n=1 Tax=Datura stramonium TaxID=4076 RepID=A0ABS8V623_DATST|nr:hypothetical protein [Datura stramonium]